MRPLRLDGPCCHTLPLLLIRVCQLLAFKGSSGCCPCRLLLPLLLLLRGRSRRHLLSCLLGRQRARGAYRRQHGCCSCPSARCRHLALLPPMLLLLLIGISKLLFLKHRRPGQRGRRRARGCCMLPPGLLGGVTRAHPASLRDATLPFAAGGWPRAPSSRQRKGRLLLLFLAAVQLKLAPCRALACLACLHRSRGAGCLLALLLQRQQLLPGLWGT